MTRRSDAALAENLRRVRDDIEKVTVPRERKEGAYYSLLLQLADLALELERVPLKEVGAAAQTPKLSMRSAFQAGAIEVQKGVVVHVDFKARKLLP